MEAQQSSRIATYFERMCMPTNVTSYSHHGIRSDQRSVKNPSGGQAFYFYVRAVAQPQRETFWEQIFFG
jgi:hypothetical protein